MAKAATCNTTVGVFSTRDAAERAIDELKNAGYRDDQIGLVAKDANGKTVRRDGSGAQDTNAAEGAAIGAVAGGGALALGSLAVSFGVIPVIGPVLAVGPLAAALISAAGGATAAGVAGALIGWGIPEEDARYYEDAVQSGRYLVTVECGQGDDARNLLSRSGGYDRASAPMI
ncbi:general stress protein [Gemmata sp. JC717]|uniref:general stress protein n=1 Tax=Gemmata algarum TaxID=2975278 RepID=UPI0021BB3D1C|nr:general stress protein [Gemmata algarum]MDY3555558.1 general stress protein [Gemmata algarum]